MSQSLKYSVQAFLLTFTLLLVSCNNNSDKEDVTEVGESVNNVNISGSNISAQNVFNSIPARGEIIRLIGESKIEYNPDLLNNPEHAGKYSLENSRALNLGVYGADLSVSGAFDQTQESMIFLKCVNILAKNLGVATAFDENMRDRMDVNKENRDSTLEIIAGSFKKADQLLKENNRPGTSSLILSGAWVEGIYISCEIAKTITTESIIKTILTQEESLKHLITLLEASNLDEGGKMILDDLKNLQQSFATANQSTDRSLGCIKDIATKISALRKKIVETL